MCELYGNICHSGLCFACNNGEENVREEVTTCDRCGNSIYKDEKYCDFDGTVVHYNCVDFELLQQIYDFNSISILDWSEILGFEIISEEV